MSGEWNWDGVLQRWGLHLLVQYRWIPNPCLWGLCRWPRSAPPRQYPCHRCDGGWVPSRSHPPTNYTCSLETDQRGCLLDKKLFPDKQPLSRKSRDLPQRLVGFVRWSKEGFNFLQTLKAGGRSIASIQLGPWFLTFFPWLFDWQWHFLPPHLGPIPPTVEGIDRSAVLFWLLPQLFEGEVFIDPLVADYSICASFRERIQLSMTVEDSKETRLRDKSDIEVNRESITSKYRDFLVLEKTNQKKIINSCSKEHISYWLRDLLKIRWVLGMTENIWGQLLSWNRWTKSQAASKDGDGDIWASDEGPNVLNGSYIFDWFAVFLEIQQTLSFNIIGNESFFSSPEQFMPKLRGSQRGYDIWHQRSRQWREGEESLISQHSRPSRGVVWKARLVARSIWWGKRKINEDHNYGAVSEKSNFSGRMRRRNKESPSWSGWQ